MRHKTQGLKTVLVLLVVGRSAEAGETRAFVDEVKDARTFDALSRRVESDQLGKFLIDLQSDSIYFFDVNLYRLHRDFVQGQIYRKEFTKEEQKEYHLNYGEEKPRFILGYLTHHLKAKRWTFSFWEGDRIRAKDVRRVRERLRQTFFVKDLAFRPDSVAQERLLGELKGIPTLTNDRLYKTVDYQAFNEGRAVGPLRIVPAGTPYESLVFARDEIVILQDSYPDLSPVAGVVSTTFSTPLSHVNLRAKAWGIPNAGLKGAAEKYAHLHGKVVVLEVRAIDHALREATSDQIAVWAAQKKAARTVKIPDADLATRELRGLALMTARDARTYGAKTANLGLIARARLKGVHVPDGFGVPFVFYREHMRRHGLDAELERMLADPRFEKDRKWRKRSLEGFRKRILDAPIDEAAVAAVAAEVTRRFGDRGVFVRSSTNAEDLPGFNGAGLYDTVPNVRGRDALGRALKQVWASLWNYHAVEERSFFGIPQRSVYAGVLVQVGVNATAAGVLVTKNLYDPQDPNSYTINAKRGLGLRVVAGTTVPEQVIYDTRYPGTKIVSRSDDPTMLVFDETGGIKEVPNPNRDVILSNRRARDLSKAVQKFRKLFPREILDVEWVLEGEKIWIVQARPFVTK